MGIRVGIDTGGTFTDLVGIDESTGEIVNAKRPSTPNRPVEALLAITEQGIQQVEDGSEISLLIHGTTVSLNCLLEHKGAAVLLLTTEGFEDVPFIQRINRNGHYNLQWRKPKPLVKRRHTVGVPERVNYKGEVVVPFTEKDAQGLVEELKDLIRKENIQAIAVALLFSYVRGDHERILANALRQEFPDIPVSLSHEVAPIWREYERGSTTIADAYIKPIMSAYMKNAAEGLDDSPTHVKNWAVMKSNGGISHWEAVPDQPIHTILSGPAGGLIAGRFYGEITGEKNVLTLDMGGTSADVGMIYGGEQRFTTEYEIEWGVPVAVPTLDIHTIGAGGGSLGWVDAGGLLHAGPQSAGADPGPACYGSGGNSATVTDANLVLGRLNPEFFLGGRLKLHRDLAEAALGELGKEAGMSPVEVAHAMVDIANQNMADAVRLISVQRGYDPGRFALVAFGGAGPLHAGSLAENIGIPRVVVPLYPGMASAFGMLMADLRVDTTWTRAFRSDDINVPQLNEGLRSLRERTVAELRRQGFEEEPTLSARISMRYLGQNYEQDVQVPATDLDEAALKRVYEEFEREHERFYGYHIEGEVVELVHFSVTAFGATRKPGLTEIGENGKNGRAEPVGTRTVSFRNTGEVVAPIYRREDLPAEFAEEGPLVIEEFGSTTLVHPGQRATVDGYGIVGVEVGG